MVLSALTLFSFGQLDTLKKKQTPLTKKQVLKEKSTPQTPAVKETPAPEQLPDLRFTALVVRHKGSNIIDGVEKNAFEINFTFKNEGTAAIELSKIFVQGFIGYDPNWPKDRSACGRGMGVGGMLAPGSSFSSSIESCTLSSLIRNNNAFYTLYLDYNNYIKESNEQNNTAKTTLFF